MHSVERCAAWVFASLIRPEDGGQALNRPWDVALLPDGDLFVTDENRLNRLHRDGTFLGYFGGQKSPARFGRLIGIGAWSYAATNYWSWQESGDLGNACSVSDLLAGNFLRRKGASVDLEVRQGRVCPADVVDGARSNE